MAFFEAVTLLVDAIPTSQVRAIATKLGLDSTTRQQIGNDPQLLLDAAQHFEMFLEDDISGLKSALESIKSPSLAKARSILDKLANNEPWDVDTDSDQDVSAPDSGNDDTHDVVYSDETLEANSQLIYTDDPAKQLQGATAIRKALSQYKNPPIKPMLKHADRLVHIASASSSSSELIYEAAWALSNCCSGDTDDTRAVVDAGVIPAMMKQIASSDPKNQEQAFWCLGNIAGDSPEMRDAVLTEPIAESLSEMCNLTAEGQTHRATVAWTTSNFMRGKPAPNRHLIEPFLPLVYTLAQDKDEDVKQDAFWALSYVSEIGDSMITHLDENYATLSQDIVAAMSMKSSESMSTVAVRLFGNMSSGPAPPVDRLLDAGLLENKLLRHCLTRECKEGLRKEVLWGLSNVAAGTPPQQKILLKSGVIEEVCKGVLAGKWPNTNLKEAAWVLANLLSVDPALDEKTSTFDSLGMIGSLCSLIPSSDDQIRAVAVKGLGPWLQAHPDDSELFSPHLEKVKNDLTPRSSDAKEVVDLLSKLAAVC